MRQSACRIPRSLRVSFQSTRCATDHADRRRSASMKTSTSAWSDLRTGASRRRAVSRGDGLCPLAARRVVVHRDHRMLGTQLACRGLDPVAPSDGCFGNPVDLRRQLIGPVRLGGQVRRRCSRRVAPRGEDRLYSCAHSRSEPAGTSRLPRECRLTQTAAPSAGSTPLTVVAYRARSWSAAGDGFVLVVRVRRSTVSRRPFTEPCGRSTR